MGTRRISALLHGATMPPKKRLPTTGCWICGEHGVINDALYNTVVESVGRGHAWSYTEATA